MRFEYYRMQEYSLVPVLFFSAVKMYIIYQKIKKTENVLTCLVYYIFLQPPDDAHVSCVWPPAAPYVTLVIGANWGSQLCNHGVTRSRCFTAKKYTGVQAYLLKQFARRIPPFDLVVLSQWTLGFSLHLLAMM